MAGLSLKGLRTIRNRRNEKRRLAAVRPSHADELWYRKKLLAMVSQLTATVERELIGPIKRHPALTTDAAPLDLSAIITRLASRFATSAGFAAEELANQFIKKSKKSVDGRLKRAIIKGVGVDLADLLTDGPIAEQVIKARQTNISLIKSIPEQYFSRIEKVLQKGFESGLRSESLVAAIQEIGNVTKRRAKLIARDQTATVNSSLNEARQTSLGIDSYTWRTAEDERVVGKPGGLFPDGNSNHMNHFSRNGEEFQWNDPPPDGHPGMAINCRCVAIPIINLEKSQ